MANRTAQINFGYLSDMELDRLKKTARDCAISVKVITHSSNDATGTVVLGAKTRAALKTFITTFIVPENHIRDVDALIK